MARDLEDARVDSLRPVHPHLDSGKADILGLTHPTRSVRLFELLLRVLRPSDCCEPSIHIASQVHPISLVKVCLVRQNFDPTRVMSLLPTSDVSVCGAARLEWKAL